MIRGATKPKGWEDIPDENIIPDDDPLPEPEPETK